MQDFFTPGFCSDPLVVLEYISAFFACGRDYCNRFWSITTRCTVFSIEMSYDGVFEKLTRRKVILLLKEYIILIKPVLWCISIYTALTLQMKRFISFKTHRKGQHALYFKASDGLCGPAQLGKWWYFSTVMYGILRFVQENWAYMASVLQTFSQGTDSRQ